MFRASVGPAAGCPLARVGVPAGSSVVGARGPAREGTLWSVLTSSQLLSRGTAGRPAPSPCSSSLVPGTQHPALRPQHSSPQPRTTAPPPSPQPPTPSPTAPQPPSPLPPAALHHSPGPQSPATSPQPPALSPQPPAPWPQPLAPRLPGPQPLASVENDFQSAFSRFCSRLQPSGMQCSCV